MHPFKLLHSQIGSQMMKINDSAKKKKKLKLKTNLPESLNLRMLPSLPWEVGGGWRVVGCVCVCVGVGGRSRGVSPAISVEQQINPINLCR